MQIIHTVYHRQKMVCEECIVVVSKLGKHGQTSSFASALAQKSCYSGTGNR